MPGTYPADTAETALRLFLAWFGSHYARSTTFEVAESGDSILSASITVGRRWPLSATVIDLASTEADLAFEAERAAIERRFDDAGLSAVLWTPRAAPLPAGGPALDDLMNAVRAAQPLADGRRELRRPVSLYLRRTGTTGSVITVLGGLSAHWAQFTNRVAGTFQLNSNELHRLPSSEEERSELAERIVLAAGQPDVDDGLVVRAEEAWSLSDLGDGGSCVIGSPIQQSDDQAAAQRRQLRALLRGLRERPGPRPATEALVVLGVSDYASDEKLSWMLRGMDPTLYGGFAMLAVVTDGVVKSLLEPGRSTLPWDSPLPGAPVAS